MQERYNLSSILREAGVCRDTIIVWCSQSNPVHPLSHKEPPSPTVQLNEQKIDPAILIIFVVFLDNSSSHWFLNSAVTENITEDRNK